MDKIKLNGYYIDIASDSYNTMGRVNENEWRENLNFFIDLNKKVFLDEGTLRDVREFTTNSKSNSDIGYEPIGDRLGEKKDKFNTIIFSSLSIGKGVYRDENKSIVKMNNYGIVLPGYIAISLDDNENEKLLKIQGDLIFNDFKNIKNQINSLNSLSIGKVDYSTLDTQIPGICAESFELLKQDPKKFLEGYCKDSNQDYQIFKKFIIKLHQMFNIVQWSFENQASLYPSLILLIGKTYNDLNQENNHSQLIFEYMLSFHSDLNGLNSNLLSIWNDECKQNFKMEQFQKPISLVFMTMEFDCVLYDTSLINKRLIQDIVNSPFSDMAINQKGVSSLEFCKSLLNVTTIDQVKSRSIISPRINYQEPSSKSEISTSKIIDEKFIKQLSDLSFQNNLQGIVLYSDRADYSGIYQSIIPPPSMSTFDDCISKFYSKENSDKLKYLLNKK